MELMMELMELNVYKILNYKSVINFQTCVIKIPIWGIK